MALADIAAEIHAHQAMVVEHQTFGHLAPKEKRIYTGWVLFACGCFGSETMVLDWAFEDLDSSPWFFRQLNEWVDEQVRKRDYPAGYVWRFEGTYRLKRDGDGKFTGKVIPMRLQRRFATRRRS